MVRRKCELCGTEFEGGYAARFCPDCRKKKEREYISNYGERLRAGTERTLGEEMTCERCGGTMIHRGALQKFCLECRKELARERARKIETDKTLMRRSTPTVCKWCEKEFYSINGNLYCSDDCRKKRAAAKEHRRRAEKKVPVVKTCKYCGQQFFAERGRVYCGSECAHQAMLRYQREYKRRRRAQNRKDNL